MAQKKQSPGPDYVLRGHRQAVNSIKFLDSQRLASGSLDGSLKLWSLEVRRATVSINNAHTDSITAVRRLGQDMIATSGRDGFVKVWNMAASEVAVPSCAFATGSRHFCPCATVESGSHPNLILAPSAEDSNILLIDIRAKVPQLRLRGPDGLGMVTSLAIDTSPPPSTPSSTPLVATLGFESGSILMVDLRNYGVVEGEVINQVVECDQKPKQQQVDLHDTRPKRYFEPPPSGGQPVMSTLTRGTLGEQGKFILYSCGADRKLMKRACGAGQAGAHTTEEVKNPSAGASSVALRQDGKVLAVGCWDSTVRVFEADGMRPLAVLRQHQDSVFAVDYSRSIYSHPSSEAEEGELDRGVLASASKDTTIMIWSLFGDDKEKETGEGEEGRGGGFFSF